MCVAISTKVIKKNKVIPANSIFCLIVMGLGVRNLHNIVVTSHIAFININSISSLS